MWTAEALGWAHFTGYERVCVDTMYAGTCTLYCYFQSYACVFLTPTQQPPASCLHARCLLLLVVVVLCHSGLAPAGSMADVMLFLAAHNTHMPCCISRVLHSSWFYNQGAASTQHLPDGRACRLCPLDGLLLMPRTGAVACWADPHHASRMPS